MPRSSANFALLYLVHLLQPKLDAVSEPTSQHLPHCSLSALNSSECCSSVVLYPYAHSSDCSMEGLKELMWANEGPCQEKGMGCWVYAFCTKSYLNVPLRVTWKKWVFILTSVLCGDQAASQNNLLAYISNPHTMLS